MKVVITPPTVEISDNHNYSKGAIANIFYNLLFSLSKYDIESYVLSKGIDVTKSLPNNIKVYELTKSRYKNSHYIHVKSFFKSIRLTQKLLKEKDVSVINQMYFPYGVGFNPMIKKIRDYPFIIGMCELPHKRYSDEISKVKNAASIIGKKFIYSLFLKTLDACDTLIAVNNPTKDLYSELISRKKIKIIPYGVDMNKFRFTPLQEDNYNILVVSRLIKRRKIGEIISAMSFILNEYPNARLHIIGEGPEKENLLTKYGILKRTFFYGNVNENKLIELYKNCYVYCTLSEDDGWNQPILEAMASGRPVICADAQHNSMVTNKTGFKLHYNDSIEYATKIKQLFGDFEMAQKMGKEAREEVERNYNWDDIGRKYYEAYKEII